MNTTFTCTGSIHVEGWGKAINCSKRAGHGTQTLKVATGNSCNPAFVTMGLKIGTEAYYRYLKSFGLMETTGIDLPAEAEGIFANEDSFNSNVVSLAAYSFGQTFNVTPLELIRAQAATINGGYLYTPYLVEQVLDDEGNILSQHETTAVRQVISEETSAKVPGVPGVGGVRRRRPQRTGDGLPHRRARPAPRIKPAPRTWWCPLCASPRRTTHSTSCC